MTQEAASLALEGVTRRFGDFTAVHPLDLELAGGEMLALLGPSGCGKTTTLRMIAGFETPDAGRVLIAGRDVTGVCAGAAPARHGVPELQPVPAHDGGAERRLRAAHAGRRARRA